MYQVGTGRTPDEIPQRESPRKDLPCPVPAHSGVRRHPTTGGSPAPRADCGCSSCLSVSPSSPAAPRDERPDAATPPPADPPPGATPSPRRNPPSPRRGSTSSARMKSFIPAPRVPKPPRLSALAKMIRAGEGVRRGGGAASGLSARGATGDDGHTDQQCEHSKSACGAGDPPVVGCRRTPLCAGTGHEKSFLGVSCWGIWSGGRSFPS